MNRATARRRLAWGWWWQVLLTLAPLLVLYQLFADLRSTPSVLAMPLFILGCCSLFVSLAPFKRYMRALIATEKALNSDSEAAAWQALGRTRQRSFIAAGLPAWIAALAVLTGLEVVPLLLLAAASLVLLYLYRIPRQLG
ncbi:MAG: MFS transporter [Pseudomonas sp.]|nr:MFS transporter [Pseudomonas sp.]